MEERLRHMAFYDALTSLPNRRLLDDRLKQALSASKRSGRRGAVMFLDLDNFKLLNDAHGHVVGDLLLFEAAARLKGCVRETDTVARFGDHAASQDDILKWADAAMYQAKEAGCNLIRVFESTG